VPGLRWTRPRSFGLVNKQLRRALACSDAIRRFKKLPTTCIDVRPPVARDLILPNTGSNSGVNDGLALHYFLSSLGPSLGSTRRSLASVLAITHSARQFSHLVPLREEI
jgi:cell shape-determining protein MreC